MKKLLFAMFVSTFALNASAAPASEENGSRDEQTTLATRNLERSMALVDGVISKCFIGSGAKMEMKDVYDLNRHARENGTSDVWPYTAVMEAVNSIIEGIDELKEEAPDFYELDRERYVNLLNDLYRSIRYYAGSYKLVSYARTEDWMDIYGVHRGSRPGAATVTGIENVYDDQMWLAREFIRAYKNTGMEGYKTRAEYLIEYILDGWDVCVDSRGEEYGGITWGPGYNSKHACSNSPVISPLVWMAELYKGSDETTTYYYVNKDNTRSSKTVNKYEYYLDYAKKVYAWQKEHLYDSNTGCFHDMCGGVIGEIQYEEVDGVTYRKHVDIGGPGGTQYTYNTGTMLCGAVDLYLATGDEYYLNEAKEIATDSYEHFRGTRKTIDGENYFPFPYDSDTLNGFNAWFNNVLLRAYVDAVPYAEFKNRLGALDNYAKRGCENFQDNLDYAYENYLKDGFLPNNLLGGWEQNTKTKAFHQAAYAAEYAKLVQYIMTKDETTDIKNFNVETAGKNVNVYSIDGSQVRSNVSKDKALDGLRSGIYVVDGEKHFVK